MLYEIPYLGPVLRRLGDEGHLRGWTVEHRVDRDSHTIRLQGYNGQGASYEITETELRLDGEAALGRIAGMIEDQVREWGRAEPVRPIPRPGEMVLQQQEYERLIRGQWDTRPRDAQDPSTLDEAYLRQLQNDLDRMSRQQNREFDYYRGLYQQRWPLGPLWGPGGPRSDPEADRRAEELFKTTAGEEAHETLARGGPLPLTGSKGGRYQLFRRATYCVESDSHQFCAVVPGVPLWDHLLGIKLMIERDEDKFLKTANKAWKPEMGRRLVSRAASMLGNPGSVLGNYL